ncbi:MAG: GNAT family N-acetyltransferase [bacterium]
MEMKTERLIVRSFRFEDAVDLFDMCCDEETSRDAGWKPHMTLADTNKVISGHIFEDDTYAVVLQETGRVIGTVSLYDVSKKDLKAKELGFCLNKKYRGKGYMLEAASFMVKLAFRAMRVDVVNTCHATYNIKCKNLINKLPFKSLGISKKHRRLYDRTHVDCELYQIKTEDY